ncbi:hypothetical protein Q6D67_13460, partial [Haliea sp. E1-2-M8]|uniref:hypothetical protein n=1 Tax=Haliea sp. E1-2-M8 TaxID=3064706 RepID=UPI00271CA256
TIRRVQLAQFRAALAGRRLFCAYVFSMYINILFNIEVVHEHVSSPSLVDEYDYASKPQLLILVIFGRRRKRCDTYHCQLICDFTYGISPFPRASSLSQAQASV